MAIGTKLQLMTIITMDGFIKNIHVMKKLFILLIFLINVAAGCEKEFDVYLNNNQGNEEYQTECGTVKVNVSQLRNESFSIYVKFQITENITFYKDSIDIVFNKTNIDNIEFIKTHNSKDIKINMPSTTVGNEDEIFIGFLLRDVKYNYPDTIHVYSKGAFYCKGKSAGIDKINIIVKEN